MCLWTKSQFTTTTTQKIKHKKPCRGRKLNPGSLAPSGCVTTTPPSQLRVSIVNKLFNCFDAMGRNLNKQSWICGNVRCKHLWPKRYRHSIFNVSSQWCGARRHFKAVSQALYIICSKLFRQHDIRLAISFCGCLFNVV